MQFQNVLGDVWHISDDLVTDLEELTRDMYRHSILKQKTVSNIDFSQFPLCRKTLSQHIRLSDWKIIRLEFGN